MCRTLILLLTLAWLTALAIPVRAAHAVPPTAGQPDNEVALRELETQARDSLDSKTAVGLERYRNRQAYRRALVSSLHTQAQMVHVQNQQGTVPTRPAGPATDSIPTPAPIAFLLGCAAALGLFLLWQRRAPAG